jgi:poly(A) polymerase
MEEHPQARFVVDTLSRAGFVAYYAGGWVRDFLLGHPSDDIDIATNAPPETIQALFPKTVPIGISFGIILVIVEGHQYEVATFRNDLDYKDGRRPSRIEFTTAIEDAKRRDFTINGMFYDPQTGNVLDFVEGKKDLEKQIIRAIGNPNQRIFEDRLRMIRAIRLACRFHFKIDPATAAAIRDHAQELFPAVAIERVVQELDKGLKSGKLRTMLIRLHEFNLLPTIFPALKNMALEEIERRLTATHHFPKTAPLIAYLLELFPDGNLHAKLGLCKFLKLPNLDQQFTSFLVQAEELHVSRESIELSTWAHFYANPWAEVSLQIIAAHLDEQQRIVFFAGHEKRKLELHRPIQRIQTHAPLVTSKDLIDLRVAPGKTMGILLREAERIAINEQIDDKKRVLDLLRQHPIWPN